MLHLIFVLVDDNPSDYESESSSNPEFPEGMWFIAQWNGILKIFSHFWFQFVLDKDDINWLDENDIPPPSNNTSKPEWNNYVNLENGGQIGIYVNILFRFQFNLKIRSESKWDS